jgi:hypothetical protein
MAGGPDKAHGWVSWMMISMLAVSASHAAKPPLTLEAAVATRRVMRNFQEVSPGNPQGAVSLSPDQRRYVMRVIQGDVKANGVWMELFAGATDSLDTAARPQRVATLFTSGLGDGSSRFGPVADVDDFTNPLRWVDDERVAFLWSNPQGIRQVVRIDVVRGTVEFLTDHRTHIVNFALIGRERLLYNAQARRTPPLRDTGGMYVPAHADANAVFRGDWSPGTLLDRAYETEWFSQHNGAPPQSLAFEGRSVQPDFRAQIYIAPDEQQALINVPARDPPLSWDAYEQRDLHDWLTRLRREPGDTMARNVHQWHVLDLKRGEARPLWNAPVVAEQSFAAWSRSGRHVAVFGTFVPLATAQDASQDGLSSAVVDVVTGRSTPLPLRVSRREVISARWISESRIELIRRQGAALERSEFTFQRGRWVHKVDDRYAPPSTVRFDLREDLNTPPQVMATHAQRSRVLLDLNPELAQFELGMRERLQGRLSSGEAWHAILFHPTRSDASPAPLVIQSVYGKGELSDEFTLYGYQEGAGVGPSVVPSYPGQLLAQRGIAVLHFNVVLKRGSSSTPQEPRVRMRAFEEVSAELATRGLIDPARVALLGFSRNGYFVEFTITHSRVPFAAAVSIDNWDPSYFQQTLIGYGQAADAVNGAAPFGDGLHAWLENAPAFNADKVQTPLLMIDQTLGHFGVLARWELFSRLRFLRKPVAFYLPPNFDQGAHVPQNPEQILALQREVIAWCEKWLISSPMTGCAQPPCH